MTCFRFLFLLLTLGLHGLAHAQNTAPYVIMIGVDGLRPASMNAHDSPNLYKLAQKGIHAQAMRPAMPSKTFVNFYSLATGLHPEHHGLVSNYPFDRKLKRAFSRRTDTTKDYWWGGEPIWITAEKQGVKSATYYWVGSETPIGNVRPSFWKPFNQSKDYGERVTEVLQWLSLPEAERPHFVTLYFSAVDSAAHMFGVNSTQETDAIQTVDKHIGDLIAGIEKSAISADSNIIVLSDHGMINLSGKRIINLDSQVDWSQFAIPDWHNKNTPVYAPFLNLYGDEAHVDSAYKALTENTIEHLRVIKRGALPANYHFDHPQRGPDLMLLADPGWSVFASKDNSVPDPTKLENKATHGYDNQAPEMAATFIASGPAFASSQDSKPVAPFDNIEVYNVIACALGITPAKNDGNLQHVNYLLSAQNQQCLTQF